MVGKNFKTQINHKSLKIFFTLQMANKNISTTVFGREIDQSQQTQIIGIICAANLIQTWNLVTIF